MIGSDSTDDQILQYDISFLYLITIQIQMSPFFWTPFYIFLFVSTFVVDFLTFLNKDMHSSRNTLKK